MRLEVGNWVKDEDGNIGLVCIKWNDGDLCAIENDAAHPNPVVVGRWPEDDPSFAEAPRLNTPKGTPVQRVRQGR